MELGFATRPAVAALALLTSVTCATPAPPPTTARRARIAPQEPVVAPGGEHLHEYVERLTRLGAFSGSVLVARDDEILLDGGFGLAIARLGVPATRATVYDIGSVAKQFTAAAILRLEVDERLSTDEALERLFPEAPKDKRSITLHQLLTHTSGLPGDLESSSARTTRADDPRLAERLLALPLASPPGTRFRYSNAGYALLRIAIERAAGVPFARYVSDRLLAPAGLTRTGWDGDTKLWREDEVAHGAWGLYESGSPRTWPIHGATLGAGQMVSSPGELYRWLRALDAGAVLPAESVRKLFEPRARWTGLGASERGPGAHYAYGWEVRERSDGTVGLVFHNGTYGDFRTTVRRYPSDRATVIVATHARQQDADDRADELANALRDLMLGVNVPMPPATIELSSAELTAFEGQFGVSPTDGFQVRRTTPERLWLAPHGQRAFDALWSPTSEGSELGARAAQRTLEFLKRLQTERDGAEPSDWNAMFNGWSMRLGSLEHAGLVGVAPATWSKDGAFVYTALDFARGRLVVTWVWRGDELVKAVSAEDVAEPQGVPLAPIDATRFVAYDAFTNRCVPVQFVAEPEGGLTLIVGDGAARMSTPLIGSHRSR